MSDRKFGVLASILALTSFPAIAGAQGGWGPRQVPVPSRPQGAPQAQPQNALAGPLVSDDAYDSDPILLDYVHLSSQKPTAWNVGKLLREATADVWNAANSVDGIAVTGPVSPAFANAVTRAANNMCQIHRIPSCQETGTGDPAHVLARGQRIARAIAQADNDDFYKGRRPVSLGQVVKDVEAIGIFHAVLLPSQARLPQP